LTLQPGQTGSVNVVVNVPEGTAAGDHAVVVSIGNQNYQTFFFIRVTSFEPAVQKVLVTRDIFINEAQNSTLVNLTIQNGLQLEPQVDVSEVINKTIAENASELKFTHDVPTVIQNDPILDWRFMNFTPQTQVTEGYVIPGVLQDLSDYIYWIISQVTITNQTSGSILGYSTVLIPQSPANDLIPQESNIVPVQVDNLLNSPQSVNVSFILPGGWTVFPPSINYDLAPGQNKTFDFQVSPPANASGYYVATVVVGSNNGVVEGQSQLVILPRWSLVSLWPLLLIIVPLAFILGREYYLVSRRKKKGGKNNGGNNARPASKQPAPATTTTRPALELPVVANTTPTRAPESVAPASAPTEPSHASPEDRRLPTASEALKTNQALKAIFTKQLAGSWAVDYSRTFYDDGVIETRQEPSRSLRIAPNGAWIFGRNTGSWRVEQITPSDRTDWGLSPFGTTHKIVLYGWYSGVVSGPVKIDPKRPGKVDSFWLIYRIKPPMVKKPGQVRTKFGNSS
jgi:hypothetical protein